MLGDHLHQPNINPILGRCFVFAEYRCNTPEYTPPPLKLYPGRFWYLPVFWYLVDSKLYPGVDPVAIRIYPSLPEYTPLFVISVFESQNQPSLPEYTPLFNQFICATLPESTPPSQNILPFSTNLYVRPSQNLPLPPRIYPLFNKCRPIYVTLPESTSPSQNIPPFSPTICDPLRIYPSQNIPPFSTNVYVRPSQNIPLPLKIYPLFNHYVRPSHNLPLPRRIYSSLFNNYNIMRPFQNRPLPPEYTPPFSANIILCDPPRIYPSLPEYTSPFLTTICDPPRIYPSLSEYTPLFNKCILCATLPEYTPPSLPEYTPLFNN